MVDIDEICEPEWAEWYRLTPAERWEETAKLYHRFRALGGSLDPEPDTQSPFFDPEARRSQSADGRPGVRVVRRSGV